MQHRMIFQSSWIRVIKHISPSLACSLNWLAGEIKESLLFLQRVGNVAPTIVVWPFYCLNRIPIKLTLELNWAHLLKYHQHIKEQIYS